MQSRGAVRICALVLPALWCQVAGAQTLITTNTSFDGVAVPFPTGTLDINGASANLSLLNGATLTGITSLTVANSQNGGLVLNNGSVFTNTGNAFIAADNGTVGSVFFSGAAPSTWNTDIVLVGLGGRGFVTLTSGGTINATLMSLGFLTTGSGTVRIENSNSAVRLTNDLNVGLDGQGTLNVLNGGTVVSNGSFIGSSNSGVGNVLVSGTNSQWTVTSSILLGFHGQGTMTIQNGGRLQTAVLHAGSNTSGLGVLTVTGANSTANISSELRLGDRGTGAFTAGGGAQVAVNMATLGSNTTGSASGTIRDFGTRLTVTDRLTVGDAGTGSLLITLSGSMVTGTAMLGSSTGGVGNVTISGNGTRWTVTNDLYIGGNAVQSRGTGTVTVMGGATLTVGGLLKTWNNGTLTLTGGTITTHDFDRSLGTFRHDDGTFTVQGGQYTHASGTGGAGNILTINGPSPAAVPILSFTTGATTSGVEAVVVGADRQGRLFLSGGSVLTNTGTFVQLGTVSGTNIFRGQAYVGLAANSTGTATVTGAGSQWSSLTLEVGKAGAGTLNVSSGGAVVNFFTTLGTTAGGVGTATVTGTGSRLTLTNGLFVGGLGGGSGNLTVSAGAIVTSGTVGIAAGAGSTGTALITGSNTRLQVTNDLFIGGGALAGGTGSLTVADTGVVNVADSLHLYGQGTLTVTSGGSVTARSFDRTLGTFNHFSGAITVSGGLYTHATGTNTAANVLTLNGPTVSDNPTFLMSGGATETGVEAVVVGATNQGRLNLSGGAVITQLGTGSTLTTIASQTIGGGSAYLGIAAGSGGMANVTGTNSRWVMQDSLFVALAGQATLTVGNGGFVAADNAVLGQFNGAVGNVIVNGAQSRLALTDGLFLGGQTLPGGVGTLDIRSGGGRVDVGNLTRIASGSTLTIGSGSTLATGSLEGSLTNNGTLIVGGNNAGFTYTGEINGMGAVTKTGGGTWTIGSVQNYTGATSVLGGTINFTGTGSITLTGGLNIGSGATFDNTGAHLVGPGVIVNNGTFIGDFSPGAGVTMAGTGLFDGTRIIGGGGVVSPGNSPGTQNVANEVWASGGNYLWEINDADAGMGIDPGWDWLQVTNQLNITATNGGKFNILITSLNLANSTGPVHDFDPLQNYSWVIATAGGGITGFDSADFNLDTSGFQNSFGGAFGILLAGNDLQLTYTGIPEPSSVLLTIAAAGGMLIRRRRRRLQTLAPGEPTAPTEVPSAPVQFSNEAGPMT